MYPKILHIYGPIWINSYGLMISIGVMTVYLLALNSPLREKLLSKQKFVDIMSINILSAIIGGRFLFILENLSVYKENWLEIFYPWVGGFSSLGSVLSVIIASSIYLYFHRIKILSFLDLLALYGPLLQGIARIGCFLAGCCYGAYTDSIFSIVYTHPDCVAPLHVSLYPSQLLESMGSFLIFIILYFFLSKIFIKSGQILFSYLILNSVLRFLVDFIRGDWEPVITVPLIFLQTFSFTQIISVMIFVIGCIGLWYVKR